MNPLPRQVRYVRRVTGFTLVEVLVSIVVLSFGLLGMVGLQAASLQANRDARLQSTAVVLARELAEMMRGNKDQALLSSNNPYLIGLVDTPLAAPTPSYCLTVGSSCSTVGAVAQAELTDWLARVDDALPGARVSICRDSTPFASDGTAQWDCTSTNNSDPILVKIGWSRPSLKSGDSTMQQASSRPSVVLTVTPGSTL
ncbi:type IV pilus assembly protein PilV [Variovorax boronicumulans]|uniref:type IV pilus modification protein PilV n=1 Tax=Variovorax boronicumulans TaxID=436515 RepID=UPI0027822C87|nr:type IV pilus modification protein PilV [Variovorax boronicumulans]MDQ0073242.1 type IV pilus assembly protein PilV [Variovorax boronicumulans]